jgi:hypothetical protein
VALANATTITAIYDIAPGDAGGRVVYQRRGSNEEGTYTERAASIAMFLDGVERIMLTGSAPS